MSVSILNVSDTLGFVDPPWHEKAVNVPKPLGYVTIQGASSTTWRAPPLDGSMFVPEMIDWHMKYSASHPFAILAGESVDDCTTLTWGEVGRRIYALAAIFGNSIPHTKSDNPNRPIKVGILVNLDSLTYATTVLALLRAGFEPVLLSTRNSVPAFKHLLGSTDTNILIGSLPRSSGQGTALEHITQSILEELPSLTIISPPKYSDLYAQVKGADALLELPPVRSLPSYKDADDSWPCVVLHSSGSTKFPKPIRLGHRSIRAWLSVFWRSQIDTCGSRWASMSLPMFHAMGLVMGVFGPVSTGMVPVFFRPSDPPKIPTPENLLHCMQTVRCDYVLAVPSTCEKWAESEGNIKQLTSLKGLFYGGGPISQAAGEQFVAHGIPLGAMYGLTEAGGVAEAFSNLGGNEWTYFRLIPGLSVRLIPEDNGVYRLVVKDSLEHPIAVSNVEGERAYDTMDLLQAHPSKEGYYRIIGRADDQIMMSNGEKTNPRPMEDILIGNPLISAAIMFGRGKAQVGVVIEPATEVNITNHTELEDFRNAIWPSIEKANAFAPAHSRIFKELILVVDPREKPFARAAKGTVMRGAVLKEHVNFAQEIEALYEAAERITSAEWAMPPKHWTKEGVKEFVSRVVHGIIQERHGEHPITIQDDIDMFEQGCDSLQATYIRNAILSALRQAHQSQDSLNSIAQKVTPNVVFTYHTVDLLAEFVWSLLTEDHLMAQSSTSEVEKRMAAMLQMVAKYSNNLRSDAGRRRDADVVEQGDAILLTGSTGSLGTYLLHALLEDPMVSRVYAVNRTSPTLTLLDRQTLAFRTRGVDIGLLDRSISANKLLLIEADIGRPDLGLKPDLLAEMRSRLTSIIHNAWRLDFNRTLPSFESHVQGTVNLINLALSSTRASFPRFIFTSSVGVVSNWSEPHVEVPETSLSDPRVAVGNGYGESKWVAEHILHNVAERFGLNTTTWRIGQLAGSTINGAWSVTDWVPIIVRSGQELGMLPTYDQAIVSWLPVDSAARTILDSLKASEEGPTYLHLVHPHPQQWSTIFSTIAQQLKVPLVPYSEWFAMLEQQSLKDPAAVNRNPAIKLLAFFRPREEFIDDGELEAMGLARLSTDRAENISNTLASLPVLTEDDVIKWLEYWEKNGLLQ